MLRGTHTYTRTRQTGAVCMQLWQRRISLYKILFHCKAFLRESIILLLPPRSFKAYPIAILVHAHCAIYTPTTDPPPFVPYTMKYW